MRIKNIIINNKSKAFLIAEIGLAHEGSLGLAKTFIDKAKQNGADAVKFQMHIPQFESSKYESFRVNFSFQDKSRFKYWERTSFKFNEWLHLKKYAEKKKIIFLCSPFSTESVDHLLKIKIDAWKIPSGEVNNYLMLKHIIKYSNKPIILSSGLSNFKEIENTIKFIKKKLIKKKIKNKLALLQCTSKYPTELKNVGHKLIDKLNKKFKLFVGLSDHSGNLNSLISGITFGAKILEFHVTFDKKFFGPDSSSSITFDQLRLLKEFNGDYHEIKNSKLTSKKLDSNIISLKKIFNKSLVCKKNIKKGKSIKFDDLIALKPQLGIPVYDYEKIIGKKAIVNIKKGNFIKKNQIK